MVCCFALCFKALGALDYEKLLRPGHSGEAQLLYWLFAAGLAYLVSQFILMMLYRF